MAWDKTIPANDALLTNFPANCRANWDALELLTDAALQIDNAKVAAAAGIVDTKLAQITTAAKVSGTALTLLANVPSGAGVLPAANSPNKLKADSLDTTPQYLDSLIDTGVFQISAGDLLQLADAGVATEKLEGGIAAPGNSKYYGTNSGGTKGFFALPTVDTLDAIGDVAAITEAQGQILYHDGTNWNALAHGTAGQFLKTQGAAANPAWASADPGSSSVGQSELKTTTGEVSGRQSAGDTLPGGSYGFYPQVKMGAATSRHWGVAILSAVNAQNDALDFGGDIFGGWTSYKTSVSYNTGSASQGTLYIQQRYITASGHDHWIFLKVAKKDLLEENRKKGDIISSYQAPDHPSANQGDATELDIPHPFGSYDTAKHEIVVVDNSDLQAMIQKKKQRREKERGVSLLQVINENYLIDDTKRPKYNPREIVKIDEEGDLEGETIKTMKTPDWAKIMISNDEINLKKRMVEKLPDDILFKKMAVK